MEFCLSDVWSLATADTSQTVAVSTAFQMHCMHHENNYDVKHFKTISIDCYNKSLSSMWQEQLVHMSYDGHMSDIYVQSHYTNIMAQYRDDAVNVTQWTYTLTV